MITSGVGVATGTSSEIAVGGAIEKAQEQLGGNEVELALVFAASSFNQREVLQQARTLLGEEVVILGGSTAGEISQEGPSMSPSVVVMLLSLGDGTAVGAASVSGAHENPEEKGEALGGLLKDSVSGDVALMLMVADGLKVNPSAVLRGLRTALPEVPVVGGSSGDDGNYKETFQYSNTEVLTSSVAAVALSGDIKHAVGVRHGWTPISSEKKITKAEGVVIKEIDGKPAIALYEEFIGADNAADLKEVTLAELALSYPLGIKDESSGEMLLRAPFYVDAEGSITCGGEVAEGAEVVLMMGNKESAIDAAEQSAKKALEDLGTEPRAAVIFNCHVRDTLFASREQAKKEIDVIQNVIGKDVPLAGFYTYAEQAPIDDANLNIKTCNNVNHNETIVILLLA